jgi:hypothetical protein
MKQKRILVITTHAIRDPLTEGLTLHFMKANAGPNIEFCLITFESSKLRPTNQEIVRMKDELKVTWNIQWHPCQFYEGSILSPKKFFSLIGSFLSLIKLHHQFKAEHAFAICSQAAAAFYLIRFFRRTPFSVYAFEPHAELMAEIGVWNKSGANFKVLNLFERRSALAARHIMTGTDAMMGILRSWGVKAQLHKVPTGSDEKIFRYDPIARREFRTLWKAGEKVVVTYVGKFGGLYLSKELVLFFAAMYKQNPNLFFMVLTPNDHQIIRGWFLENGIPDEAFTISLSPLAELTQRLSACDLGVIAYADVPSRKYCSPTKAGNYLMSGLPFIVQKGTSEDDLLAKKHRVGVVVEDFKESRAKESIENIRALLSENRAELANRCMVAGREERSNQRAVEVWRMIISA